MHAMGNLKARTPINLHALQTKCNDYDVLFILFHLFYFVFDLTLMDPHPRHPCGGRPGRAAGHGDVARRHREGRQLRAGGARRQPRRSVLPL